MQSTINVCFVTWGIISFSFLLFLVCTSSGLWFRLHFVFCFVFNFVTCSFVGFFSANILDICESIVFLPGFCVLMQ